MSMATASAIWGADVVRLALDDIDHGPITAELATEVKRRADPPGAFRSWALALPWPTFCAVVRIVSGAVRAEVEGADHGQV
jgi:anti-sigma factor RsiW